jgi:hypothetical protein
MYNLDVPANRKLIIEILNLDVDCPLDYVAFATSIDLKIFTLCPLEIVQSCKIFFKEAFSSTHFKDNLQFKTEIILPLKAKTLQKYLYIFWHVFPNLFNQGYLQFEFS